MTKEDKIQTANWWADKVICQGMGLSGGGKVRIPIKKLMNLVTEACLYALDERDSEVAILTQKYSDAVCQIGSLKAEIELLKSKQ